MVRMFPKIVSTCTICGAPILELHLVDAYGNNACYHHKEQLHFCISCGRFCGKDARLRPNMYLCSDCVRNALSAEDCSKIVNYIRKRYLELPIGAIPPFKLERVSCQDWSLSNKSVGHAIQNEAGYSVRVLDCLTKTAFAEVMAHELLHLWIYEHRLSPSNRVAEGFCNLGSFEILSGIQTEKAKVKIRNIESNPDSVYGDGFRMVKQEYDVSGWKGVINRIKKLA